ncbi:YhcN/YlaJ family sporulation lipoprotein [Shouchella shacheensis]|uniref:YhcN/YlaJ family sporulation lipoprotein n=1 Tax=Shouchella shacheensis TaxID=1649580 RepID=UPI000740296B|nr:YhcN/YlaJ family sporulation lipoprotein [Shouchella shacheensis]
MRKQKLVVFFLLLAVLTGCQGQEDARATAFKLDNDSTMNQAASDKAKDELLKMEEVTSVRGVEHNGNLYMDVHVKQKDRFHLQDIRQRGHDRLKTLYPDANIHVSTDKKVYKELEDIEEKLKANQLDSQGLKKEIDKIEDDMKG